VERRRRSVLRTKKRKSVLRTNEVPFSFLLLLLFLLLFPIPGIYNTYKNKEESFRELGFYYIIIYIIRRKNSKKIISWITVNQAAALR